MVFQHGAARAHYLQAHELAKPAAELGSTRAGPEDLRRSAQATPA